MKTSEKDNQNCEYEGIQEINILLEGAVICVTQMLVLFFVISLKTGLLSRLFDLLFQFNIMTARRMPSQRGSHINPRTCEYVTLHGKSYYADVTKVQDLEMGSLSWIIWTGPT